MTKSAGIYIVLFICFGCNQNQENEITLAPSTLQNTGAEASINKTDEAGLKQGYWIVYGNDDPDSAYPSERKIEEGNYVDDEKSGDWVYYNISGEVDSMVTYP